MTEKKKYTKYIIILLAIILLFAAAYIINIIRERQISDMANDITEKNINNQNQADSNELFGLYYNKAEEKLNSMTLEEKVGQVFFVRCPEDKQINMIKEYSPGGFVLFARDFAGKNKDEIKSELESYQSNSKIPMLIGTDEEGGTVVRVSKYKQYRKEPFKSPQDLFKEGSFEKIKEDTKEKCNLLKQIGVNVNLAPVCDVSTNINDYIYQRSFGKDAEQTAEYIETVVKEMNKNKMSSSLKHFPGYGNNIDTHTGISYDKRPYLTFETTDFLPFKAGIENNATSIMVSHNIVECMDKDYPASISSKVNKIIREELKYTGAIITDDLSMDAISQYTYGENPAILALNAGCDMITTSDINTQYSEVLMAVKSNIISEDRLNDAVKKVIAWKYYAGIII